MKRNIFGFIALFAAITAIVGCEKEEDHYLSEIKVSSSYVSLPAEGGDATITLTAEDTWAFGEDTPEWLTITPTSGAAGESTVKFHADAATDTREASLTITCAGKTQTINVIQMTEKQELPITPIATVIEQGNAAGGGNFRLKGMITRVANTQYGNFYIEDATGEIYIYGVKNAQGQYPKDATGGWDSFGIAAGDVVTLEGPYKLYNDTPEIVDAAIVAVEKSLIDVAAFDFDKLPAIDTTFELKVSAKVSPLLVSTDQDWLQVTGVSDDGAYVLHADANDYTAERTATISIKGPDALKTVSVTQVGIPATGATVTEIIAMADNSEVETLECTVVAKTGKGVVVWDGTTACYVFGDKAAEIQVADNVKVFGTKKTYNGVPEIELNKDKEEHLVKVFSSGNAFEVPASKDVTAEAGTYAADKAEYIKLSGTLSISGNYYNIALDEFTDGSKQGSVVYPLEDLGLKAFDGKKITVTGWFNGLSSKGKYINVIATKVVEFVDNPKGTATNPYLASEIAAEILAGNIPEEDVYIKGIVSAVQSEFSASYGNGTFWISDDGTAYGVAEDKKSTTEPSKDFECYRVLWFGNEKWAEGKAQVTVGDEVVIVGKTTVYKGIAETSQNNAWIHSIFGATTDADGLGSAAYPFNIAGVEAFIDRMVAAKAEAAAADLPAPTFPDVCVKGKVSAVQSEFSASYGNGTFWISDDGTAYGVAEDKKSTTEPSKDFECYRVLWFGGEKWAEGQPQVTVGDEVVVKGQMTLYAAKGLYETDQNKAWVYSLNGATE